MDTTNTTNTDWIDEYVADQKSRQARVIAAEAPVEDAPTTSTYAVVRRVIRTGDQA